MVSPKKRDSNKRNAKSSKGPNDTSSTRFNALKHGILSKESFIAVGDGQEDAEAFEKFSSDLRDTLGPIGALEELMVEKLIVLTWRSRRVLKYETAAIRSISDTAIDDWEHQQKEDPLRFMSSDGPWRSTKALASNAKRLKGDLKALAAEDPINSRPEIWESVFLVIS